MANSYTDKGVRMRLLVACAIIASLAGCSTVNRLQAANAESKTEVLCKAAKADPRLMPIHSKIPLDPDNATIEQLSDPSVPNAAERQAISDMVPVFSQCWSSRAAVLDEFGSPGVSNVFRSMINDQKTLMAGLWNGQINYGTFNTARAKIAANASSHAIALEQRNAEAVNAAQAQASQNALMFLSLQPRVQTTAPQPYQMTTPSYTNCDRTTTGVNCVTR